MNNILHGVNYIYVPLNPEVPTFTVILILILL